MGDLIRQIDNLPVKLEDLQRFITIGEEYVKAQAAMLRSMKKDVGEANDYYQAKKSEAQKVDVAILKARCRVGEAIEEMDDFHSSGRGTMKRKILPDGLNKKNSHYNQELARAYREQPKIVEDCIKRQHDIGDFVTINHVYRKLKEVERPAPVTLKGKYSIIYADPPWKYGNTMSNNFTEQGDHYPLMNITEICAIDVLGHVNDNSVLFLWVTWPILEQSFEVIKAWGFKYKAGWCWDKIDHVMGHYNSVRSELLLLGIRGSYPLEVKKLFDNVVSIKRTEHSRKPTDFRKMIDVIYPNGKALEMFYRGDKSDLSERWSTVGNEIS